MKIDYDPDLEELVGKYVRIDYSNGMGGAGVVAEILYTSEGPAILFDYGYSFSVADAWIGVGEPEDPSGAPQ